MSGTPFEGKVALVTGGGSGIGRAASRRLAAEGAAVVVADLNGEGAAATVALVEQAGGRAVAVTADISSEADNAAMYDAAAEAFGGIDLAFLNAGMLQPYIPFDQVTTALFDKIISVNLRGSFLGMQLALARLRPGGACVVTASAAGLIGFSEAAAYATSKHGLVGLVRSAARAFAAKGLRVNAICPGMVLTPMNGLQQDDAIADELTDPDYRGGLSAQHIAEVALFLLSRRAAGVNGQAQLVDAALLSSFPPLEGL
ncbi:SDR family NAD(P)-dependent oxidoreductase [Sphingomonas sanxanigenens]|uniref:Short-chain dehydrogenase n=1 Tax=Sphingomonas sanxanigenens DSM 19645 = NX02 TaxID=1123269 RepID=W0A9B2_9SPHN|nr:SDR family oxidoreductase [Sphingomonas sanxanigenens]AHE54484.1 short-chain dehydrogenase [Sphingomonas sanxanigenens DSM 19645 = NX02]